jgi:hypothetical protein
MRLNESIWDGKYHYVVTLKSSPPERLQNILLRLWRRPLNHLLCISIGDFVDSRQKEFSLVEFMLVDRRRCLLFYLNKF